MNRKKKLRLKQVSLLALGTIVLFATYFSNKNDNKEIISAQKKIEIKNQLLDSKEEGDVFYNIEYSGLDLCNSKTCSTFSTNCLKRKSYSSIE